MKQQSMRARRLSRNMKHRPAALNLVSLMDIFTILVFFLLVNSSSVQQPGGDGIRLPEARIEKLVEDGLTIEVNDQYIVVQGRKVANVAEIMQTEETRIPGLFAELEHQAKRMVVEEGELRNVTVIGDRNIPFKLLKRIMVTASAAQFGQVSLAVIKKARKPS